MNNTNMYQYLKQEIAWKKELLRLIKIHQRFMIDEISSVDFVECIRGREFIYACLKNYVSSLKMYLYRNKWDRKS